MISNFTDRLNEAFRFSGYSQVELAASVGISKALMNQYFKGLSSPRDIKMIAAIARELNVNPAWLAGFDVPQDVYELTDREIKLLQLYGRMTDQAKEYVDFMVKNIISNPDNVARDENGDEIITSAPKRA